jgi:hypothetical protein
MKKPMMLIVSAVLLAPAAVVAQIADAIVTIQPGPAFFEKATAPQPPANATKTAKAGKGKTVVDTANSPDDTDLAWVEKTDLDGDGNPEVTDVVWDDEDKVLYLHASSTFRCARGGTGEGDLLIGVNGKDNPRGRAPGSGFFVVSLDEGECGAKAAGLYGCRLDSRGNATACGAATIDDKNDDITIAAASESKQTRRMQKPIA